MDRSEERLPAVVVNGSVPPLGCGPIGGSESCISIHTPGYSAPKSESRKVKEHARPEFGAAQIEKRMPWHESGWQGEGFLLSCSFPSPFGGPDLMHFNMLVIYAHGFWPYVSGISKRLHWCCSTPAGMAGRSETSEESDKQNRKGGGWDVRKNISGWGSAGRV